MFSKKEKAVSKTTLLSIQDLNILQSDSPLIKNLNLELAEGECIGISAPTGSGKTTLFNYICNTLPQEAPDSQLNLMLTGQIELAQGCKICRVFQEPRLIPSVSVLKNIMLPLENLLSQKEAQNIASLWLGKLNLKHKENVSASILSGGEKQRASIARAFAYSQAQNKASCLFLLDEPFASQDKQNSDNIKALIQAQCKLPGCAFIVISHDSPYLELFCNRVISL